ncbi:MAG: RagB/SusD family nutrient uptake outer membrane protein [Bacteroidota bacterium]|nr:RagB/SusD family nutrient uptake outer membrane protein [Bacteroidota bacterium]
MKKYFIFLSIIVFSLTWGCKDDDFLNKNPNTILLNDQVWSDPSLVTSVLADLYGRYVDQQTITNWPEFTNFDEAFPSESGQFWRVQTNPQYDYGWWGDWDYGYIRELNLFIQKCKAADKLSESDRTRFLAEARFLRAANYFEKVKRMGGVPLITEPMEYDFSGDPTYLQHARAKESEVYDFVINELDTLKTMLPDNASIKSRATKGLALAMQARAALYAGSIAKYGTKTPSVSLSGGEVGIPAEKAQGYYQKALTAAQELISSGKYSLYLKKPDDLQDNFASLFTDKGSNPEVIFAQDFKLKSGVIEGWTVSNQPRSSAEEQQGGRVNPSLNLVQSFELLDNTYAQLPDISTGDTVYFNNPSDAFANRDARLGGTIIIPGSKFKGKTVDIWAGYMLKNGSIISGDHFGANAILPGKSTDEQVVGFDGPIDGLEYSAQTGFYVRKFLDPTVGSGQLGTQSDVWWVRYRYGEVLLNAAEAAFELGDKTTAAGYLNQVRSRAGLTKPLTESDITFDRIVHERKVELAFEGHEMFDMKRWRLAHVIWDGTNMTHVTTNLGKADEVSTMIFGLWPYKIYNPGSPNNGKYVFKQVRPSRVTSPHTWRLGNYYSKIGDDVRTNNPKIVKNPNQ